MRLPPFIYDKRTQLSSQERKAEFLLSALAIVQHALFVMSIEVDEVGGGGIVRERRGSGRFDFAKNFGGQNFAQLDSPLVERVDGPDDALSKD